MSNRRKGLRNERECANYFSENGYRIAKAQHSRYGDTDLFNMFDILAIKPNEKPKAIQVKTNQFSGKKDFIQKAYLSIPFDHVDVYAWIRHDREGWEIRRYTRKYELSEGKSPKESVEEEKILDERKHDCNIGEQAKQLVANM